MDYILRYKNIIIAVVIIFAFYLIVGEITSHFDSVKVEIKEQSRELDKGEEAIGKWKIARKELEDLKKVFLNEDALIFKRFIENNAQEVGVRITSFKTSRLEKELYWILSTHLRITGEYKDFIDFINIIERKSVEIEKISINRGKEEKTIIAEFDLRGLSLK